MGIKTENNEYILSDNIPILIGYCHYCKSEINSYDDYLIRNNILYHTECYHLLQETETYGDEI